MLKKRWPEFYQATMMAWPRGSLRPEAIETEFITLIYRAKFREINKAVRLLSKYRPELYPRLRRMAWSAKWHRVKRYLNNPLLVFDLPVYKLQLFFQDRFPKQIKEEKLRVITRNTHEAEA